MKTILSSQASHELCHNDLVALLGNEKQNEPLVCEHSPYCTRRKYSMKCIFNMASCGLKHFYDQYGNYKQMFIGSKI